MKTVFNSSEVCHVWARQSQSNGRSNARVYFEGAKIYSYGSHFCMGNIIKPGMVLLTDRSYSVTTAKHLNWVRGAVNHMDRIYCPHPEGSLINNLKVWKQRIKNELDWIADPRKRQVTKDKAKGELSAIVANVNRYLEVTGQSLTKKLPYDNDQRKEFILFFNAAQNKQVAGSLLKKLGKLEKEKQKAAEKAREEQRQKQLEHLAKWKKGGNVQTYWFSSIEEVYLRRKEDNIETSKGAIVSLNAGKILFKMIQAGKDIKGFDIDGYTVIGINGVLTIGCHKIERKEINRFAKLMGWGQIENH